MQQRDGSRSRRSLARALLLSAGFAIPAVSLIPLGTLWLWQNGFLLYWAAGAFVSVLLVVGLEWALLRRAGAVADAAAGPLSAAEWNVHEKRAWEAVTAFADTLQPDSVVGENAITSLAVKTIEIVARQIHPDDANPIWNFTVPEALTLTERVSSRLRPILIENVPLGDQLTVRQLIKLYEWRVAADWAERAYDIWRIVRLINPATALANEARERITKRLYASLREEFTIRLARAYVFEVARAAIDLYGGRLRVVGRTRAVDNAEPVAPENNKFRWTRLARQAGNAGRNAARSLLAKRQPPAP